MTKSLYIIIFILIVFGLVMLTSAGIVDAQKKFGSSYYYLTHQLLYSILPGIALLFIFSKLNYKIWKKLSLLILFGALALMVLVFIPGFGYGLKGAVRWVNLFNLSFQPSEFLKLGLVIYLAAWFGGHEKRATHLGYGTTPFLLVMGFVATLLILQPDIGTLVIVMCIALAMYLFAGASMKHFLAIILLAVVAMVGLIAIEPYRLNRIKAFIDPTVDPRGISYQINQSLISIGSGGLFGVGYGQSSQKLGFLPEVVGDSIFAVIAEEIGFVGATVTVGLFLILAVILTKIARAAEDPFARLFVLGISVWIVSQAFLNISAMLGIAPLTGVPLPLISYGGTSALAILTGLGIVINISKKLAHKI